MKSGYTPKIFSDLFNQRQISPYNLRRRLLSELFVHEDVQKLTGTLDHKWVFSNFNAFYFTFNCARVDLD